MKYICVIFETRYEEYSSSEASTSYSFVTSDMTIESDPFLFALKFIHSLGMSLFGICQYSCLFYYQTHWWKVCMWFSLTASLIMDVPSTPPFPLLPTAILSHVWLFIHTPYSNISICFLPSFISSLILWRGWDSITVIAIFFFLSRYWKSGAEIYEKWWPVLYISKGEKWKLVQES